MAIIYRTTTPASQAILLGGPQQAYRAGIILSLPVSMLGGQVANYAAECEGSIYNYSYPIPTVKYSFVMFQTAAVVVFPPGVTPPDQLPLTSWPPSGGTVVSLPMGMDIGLPIPNYYMPVSRSGAFQATQSGSHTFVLYMWGGSDDPGVGTGNAATVYPGTSSMTVSVSS